MVFKVSKEGDLGNRVRFLFHRFMFLVGNATEIDIEEDTWNITWHTSHTLMSQFWFTIKKIPDPPVARLLSKIYNFMFRKALIEGLRIGNLDFHLPEIAEIGTNVQIFNVNKKDEIGDLEINEIQFNFHHQHPKQINSARQPTLRLLARLRNLFNNL